MGATRDFQFIVGPETSTLPTSTDPVGDADLVTKGFADKTYTRGIADITALKAVGTAARTDRQSTYVESVRGFYAFDAESALTGDDVNVVTPDAGTGRWLRVQPKFLSFASNAAFETWKGSVGSAGDIYYNTTENNFVHHNGSGYGVIFHDNENLLPNGTDSFDLGAISERWRNLWLSGNATIAGNLTVEGTTTSISTTNTEIEDNNIVLNKGGNDASAEGAGLTIERTGTDGSLIYDTSSASLWKAGDVGSEVDLVTVSANQTLTTKTIDADVNTISNIANANIKSSADIARTKLAAGVASHVVINAGSGVMSSEAQLAISRGGTGQATASSAFGALSPLTTKGDIVSYGTLNVRLPVGTDGQTLVANSATATGLEWQTAGTAQTTGGVVFGTGTGITTDATNLFWNDTDNRLGIGTASPNNRLDVTQTSAGIRTTAIAIQNAATTDSTSVSLDFVPNNTTATPLARIVGVRTNAALAGDTDLSFRTTSDGGVSVVERMVIKASGNVGIGTTPSLKLDVLSTGGTAARFESTGASVFVQLEDSSGASSFIGSTNGAFKVQTPGNSFSDKLTITSAGKFIFGGVAGAGAQSGRHEFYVNSTTDEVLYLQNLSTSTSSDPREGLHVVKGSTTNTAGTNVFLRFSINAGGTGSGYLASNGGGVAALFADSDKRLKKDILSLDGSLEKICMLRPVSFKWKESDSESIGFIAQEVAEVLPSVVHKTDSGLGDVVPSGERPWSMTESGFIPYLVSAIKELKAEIEALKGEKNGA